MLLWYSCVEINRANAYYVQLGHKSVWNYMLAHIWNYKSNTFLWLSHRKHMRLIACKSYLEVKFFLTAWIWISLVALAKSSTSIPLLWDVVSSSNFFLLLKLFLKIDFKRSVFFIFFPYIYKPSFIQDQLWFHFEVKFPTCNVAHQIMSHLNLQGAPLPHPELMKQ